MTTNRMQGRQPTSTRNTLPRAANRNLQQPPSTSAAPQRPPSADQRIVTRSGRELTEVPPPKSRKRGGGANAAHWSDDEDDCYAFSAFAPRTFKDARLSSRWDDWKTSMDVELEAHENNGTWDVVPRSSVPARANVVGSRWVYAIKNDPKGERFKSRLVARGFSQKPGVDYADTYAPVARYDSLRILIALLRPGWTLHQIDFDTAYLNSSLVETIYMKCPPGYDFGDSVLLLRKAIYGLKQSGRRWYGTLSDSLLKMGFIQAHFDPCVFHKDDLCIGIYVDDCLLGGTPPAIED
jgi:reverse transcriptase-like protein